MTLSEKLHALAAFDWNATVKVDNHEWPLKRYGAMIPEQQCEDGEWSSYAESGPGAGNILWQTESVPIAVIKGDEVVVSNPLLTALIDVAEAAEFAQTEIEVIAPQSFMHMTAWQRLRDTLERLREMGEG